MVRSLFRPRSILQPYRRSRCQFSNYSLPSSASAYSYILSRFCSSSSSDSSSDSSSSDSPDPSDSIVPSSASTTTTKLSESVVGRRPIPEKRDLLSIPLFTRPHFPKIIAPIIVHDPQVCKAFTSLRDTGLRHVGLFLHKQAGSESISSSITEASFTDTEQLYKVGVLAEIIRVSPRQKGTELTFLCHHRIRWTGIKSNKPLLTLSTEPIIDIPIDKNDNLQVKAYCLSIIETMKELLRLGSFYKEQLELLLESVDINNPYHLADLGACLTTGDPSDLQNVLEEVDINERLRLTLELLKKDLETTKVSRKIHKQIEENVSKSQRKYFLNEQLKQIKRELGLQKDEKETILNKFKNRLSDKIIPENIQNVINDEMEKLSSLESSSSEYNVTRNYLDWLTEIPYGVHNKEIINIRKSERILNDIHYGLDDIKNRILEFIAISQLNKNNKNDIQGKIILLYGPPGIGKTSIGKSIANSLGREFYRFSIGGMNDIAEIKGHRRTYIGAMPGKFIQALKKTKSSNPVILIDEIDKIGNRGYSGDVSSSLLEALDPEQNSGFVDHYMDIPIDLSKVLFLCTANTIDSIPGPLLDRMQSISLSGYILEEKIEISKRYLIPRIKEESGLCLDNGIDIEINDTVLGIIIRDYCREAGVRNLKQQLEKVFRKVALKLARRNSIDEDDDNVDDDKEIVGEGHEKGKKAEIMGGGNQEDIEKENIIIEKIEITEDNIEEYLGKKVFSKDRLYETTPVGIATGLAWTSLGGATLYIECIRVGGLPSPPSESQNTKNGSSGILGLKATGQLGDVMRESTDIALSYARSYLTKNIDMSNDFFTRDNQGYVHMHVPEGATPKDGPSAGCTMVTALLSLALDKSIKQNVAMTGEITLTGQVLPVGGIREKCIAAKRSGIKFIILPNDNRKDWDELPDHIKKDLAPHFASHYDDVYHICFEKDVDDNDNDLGSVVSEDGQKGVVSQRA